MPPFFGFGGSFGLRISSFFLGGDRPFPNLKGFQNRFQHFINKPMQSHKTVIYTLGIA
jgi:hypothetical protein